MGNVDLSLGRKIIIVIIILQIIYQIIAGTADVIGEAADNVTGASGILPLTSFFKKKGVILLTLIAGIISVVVTGLLLDPKGGGSI